MRLLALQKGADATVRVAKGRLCDCCCCKGALVRQRGADATVGLAKGRCCCERALMRRLAVSGKGGGAAGVCARWRREAAERPPLQ
eukprot:923925-Rhodomonas_salina.1